MSELILVLLLAELALGFDVGVGETVRGFMPLHTVRNPVLQTLEVDIFYRASAVAEGE